MWDWSLIWWVPARKPKRREVLPQPLTLLRLHKCDKEPRDCLTTTTVAVWGLLISPSENSPVLPLINIKRPGSSSSRCHYAAKSCTIQTIPTNSIFVARQNSPITFIDTEFLLSSWKEFAEDLLLIGSKEMIWILCFDLLEWPLIVRRYVQNWTGNKNAFQWNAYHRLVDHIPACTGQGFFPACTRQGGACLEEVCLRVSAWGCLPRGLSAEGVSAQRDVCLQGGWGCGRHTPPDQRQTIPCGQNDRQV